MKVFGANNGPTSIDSLPAEVLGIIFGIVHTQGKEATQQLENTLELPVTTGGDFEFKADDSVKRGIVNQERIDLVKMARTEGFFPYNCTRVCTSWRNVLATHPRFWDRIVMYIDPDATRLTDVAHYLSWSRNSPITVIITRRSHPVRGSTQKEPELIELYLDFLRPHIHRLRSLYIDATLSHSLPSFHSAEWKEASMLVDLSLTCDVDSAGLMTLPVRSGVVNTFSPVLKSLTVDGKNFYDACHDDTHWMHRQMQLQQLTVSEFLPLGAASAIKSVMEPYELSLDQALDVFSSFENLVYLKMKWVEFSCKQREMFVQHTLENVQGLALDNVPAPLITELFRLAEFPALISLHLHNISELDTRVFDHMNPHVPMLFLSAIHSSVNLPEFLSPWCGAGICFIACRWENDSLFSGLAKLREPDATSAPPPGGREFCCPDLQVMFLLSCPIKSIQNVKKFIEERNHYVDYNDPEWRENTTFGPAIKTLMIKRVFPEDAEDLLEEDKKWFEDHLVEFRWDIWE